MLNFILNLVRRNSNFKKGKNLKNIFILFSSLMFFLIGTLISNSAFAINYQTASEHDPLRVVSYNIQTRMTRFQVAPWPRRVQAIGKLITNEMFHVVGVQEAVASMLKDLMVLLPNYGYVGHGRDDGKLQGEHTAILYNKSRLKVLNWSSFWLAPTPEVPGIIGWDASCPRIVTWAQFQDLVSRKIFFVFNTHFDHLGRIAQTNSARLLASEFHRITQGSPGIVMGDFNVSDKNAAYHLFVEQSGLADAIALAPHKGPKYTHSFFGIYKSRIDYIFVSPHLQVQQNRTIPEEPRNRHRRSDHLPIFTELGFI